MATDQTNSNNLSEFSPLVRHWGTTANRPSTDLVTGQVYADTTLKQWFSYNGSGWDAYGGGSGTSFPASPATYQRYFRTDRGVEYFWDGSAWSSVGNMVVLNQICRVLDDTTSRATGYTNSAVQVSGVTDLRAATSTLPSPLRAVWYSMFLITAAPANVRMVVENPDFVAGATTLQGSTVLVGATTAYSGSGVVSLSSLGQLRYVYGGSANVTRTIIDVWAYML